MDIRPPPNGTCSKAIFVTVEEGAGYYDSGYVPPLDFFGDGPRIPLIVVSPFTKPGHISHSYADHVSIWKFIERNWDLPAISSRSRDNLPNPKSDWDNPYVLENSNQRSVWSVPFRSRPRRRSRSRRSLTCRGGNTKSCEGRAAAKAALFCCGQKTLVPGAARTDFEVWRANDRMRAFHTGVSYAEMLWPCFRC